MEWLEYGKGAVVTIETFHAQPTLLEYLFLGMTRMKWNHVSRQKHVEFGTD